MLLGWLTQKWRYFLGNEYYEARVELPIEDVWRHFQKVIDNSKRLDFWKIQHNITGRLYDDYGFRIEEIVQTGGLQTNSNTLMPPAWIIGRLFKESEGITMVRYRVELGPSLIILALLSLPVAFALPIWAFPSGLDSSLIGFVLATGVSILIISIQFGLAQQQKLDINRGFAAAFGIRSFAVPKF